MQLTCAKGVLEYTWLGGKDDPLVIVLEINIFLTYYLKVYAQTRICSREWNINFSGTLR